MCFRESRYQLLNEQSVYACTFERQCTQTDLGTRFCHANSPATNAIGSHVPCQTIDTRNQRRVHTQQLHLPRPITFPEKLLRAVLASVGALNSPASTQ